MVAVTGTTLHWCGWDRKCNWCQSAWLQIPAVPLICWVPLGQATKQLCASSSLCVKWGWHTFHFTDNFHLLHRVTLRIKYKTALISAFLVLDKLSTSLPLCKYFWSGGWYHLLSIMAGGAGGMFRQRSVFFFYQGGYMLKALRQDHPAPECSRNSNLQRGWNSKPRGVLNWI